MIPFIKYILLPSNLISFFIFFTLLFWMLRLRKIALYSSVIAMLIYAIFGSGPVSQALLSNLEYRYPAFENSDQNQLISTIIVLTGHAESKPNTPWSSAVNPSSAYRLMEANAIYRLQPKRNVIISGFGEVPKIMAKVLQDMGVPIERIGIDALSDSTYESAVNLKQKLGSEPFILVTSAGHMPRAMAVFTSQGLHPVPAPTEFLTQQNIFATQYSPTAHHLVNADLAVHEHIALIWYRLTNQIQ